MRNIRIIARLDIKGPNLIKGIHLEGLRVIGDPHIYAEKYYAEGADELIYVDCVASLYQRNHLADIVRKTAHNIFIPITVGGVIRSVADANQLLRAGADKIAINTAAVQRPELLKELSGAFGAQSVVLSIQAKKNNSGGWEVYTDNGREHTGMDVVSWAEQAQTLGVGEILLTSVDREGTQKGFDLELVHEVTSKVNIPVIASGGMGTYQHLIEVIEKGQADAVALAAVLHYAKMDLSQVREAALKAKLPVRNIN